MAPRPSILHRGEGWKVKDGSIPILVKDGSISIFHLTLPRTPARSPWGVKDSVASRVGVL